MKLSVGWRCFIRAANKVKCERVLGRLRGVADFPFRVVAVEPYWKEKGVYQVAAETPFEAETPQDAFYKLLRMLNRFAPAWSITTPADEGQVELSGGASAGTVPVPGVDEISFHLLQDGLVVA